VQAMLPENPLLAFDSLITQMQKLAETGEWDALIALSREYEQCAVLLSTGSHDATSLQDILEKNLQLTRTIEERKAVLRPMIDKLSHHDETQ